MNRYQLEKSPFLTPNCNEAYDVFTLAGELLGTVSLKLKIGITWVADGPIGNGSSYHTTMLEAIQSLEEESL